jgi:hypothetical protein
MYLIKETDEFRIGLVIGKLYIYVKVLYVTQILHIV